MSIFQDLHYAWRNLTRTPGFLFIAVLSLALGIGANTALFSLLYSAVYRTLPVDDAQRLVLFNDPSADGMNMGSSGGERGLLTWPEFQDLQKMPAMSGLFAAQSMLPKIHIRLDGSEEDAHLKMVSGGYFSVLELQPQAGRFFNESVDNQLGAAPFVVLSDQYWSRRFGRDRSIIGKSILIQKTPFDIIGVAPRGFSGENVGQNPDLWAPLSMQMQIAPGEDFLHPQPDPTMKIMWLHVFGRLRPGANLAQAQTQASTIFKANLEQSYRSVSPEAKKGFLKQWLKLRPASTGASSMRNRFAESMSVIFTAVGLTLLICCANLSNLLLARANSRQREITVRLALGASKLRIARQLFTEGLLLSGLGAALGLLLSQAIAPLLLRLASRGEDVAQLDTQIDWRVLLFTAFIAIATTLICSLLPSIRAARIHLMGVMREGGRGLTSSRSKLTAGRLFVVAQVALSLLLLIGAGLFLRTLINLQNVDLGYSKDRLVMVGVDATAAGYSSQARGILFRNILAKLRATPGVKSVTFSENGLFSGSESGTNVLVDGYTPRGDDDRGSRFDSIGPGYFSALGIPLLQGREVDDRDTATSPNICVVNDAFAKKFFAGRNPLAKHVIAKYGDQQTVFEVVGVAKNSRDHTLRDKVPPRVFVSLLQAKFGPEMSHSPNYEVRMASPTSAVLAQLRKTVLSVDPNLEVDTRFLTRSIEEETSGERLVANLVTLFGALALALAAIGIYGILAYGVSQRVGEIGIRIAVGAKARDVISMIGRETVWIVSGGLLAGLIAAYFLTKLVASKLYGVTATDPAVTVAAVFILALVGISAAILPAWRASRIDPATALRDE